MTEFFAALLFNALLLAGGCYLIVMEGWPWYSILVFAGLIVISRATERKDA